MAIVGVKPENCNQTDLENIKSKYKKNSGELLHSAVFQCFVFLLGRQVGFEPTTHGTTIRYSNQLSYNRHLSCLKQRCKNTLFFNT